MSGRLATLVLPALALLAAAPAAARTSWVKGEVLLNVRTGPGAEHRPLGAITTGDPVTILDQADGWTHVKTESAGEGWIPAGFLQDEPPPVVRLEEVESEASELRQRVQELAAEAEHLRAAQAEGASRQAEQAREIERLSQENATLQADAIWPLLIVGASILFSGGLIGAWMRGGGRRGANRVRL
jgi:SH3 domain protein